MSNLPTTLTDFDPDHTAGHNAQNTQINTNSRPATVQTITHSAASAVSIDAEDGHVCRITVGANITGWTLTNFVTGLPFLLILEGDGVADRTVDLSTFNLTSSETLNPSTTVTLDGILHIAFVKDHFGTPNYWAPAGVQSWVGGGTSGGGSSEIEFVASGILNFVESFSTTHSVPLPDDIQSGDLIEICVATQESIDPAVPTTPGTYTQRWSVGADAPFRPRHTKVYKIADGTEGGTSVTITWGVSTRACGVSHVWRNVDETTPYDVAAPTVALGSGNPNPPSITPVSDDCMIVAYATGNVVGGAPSTISSGYTSAVDTDADDRSHVNCYKKIGAATTENPSAYTWSIDNSTSMTDALRQAT